MSGLWPGEIRCVVLLTFDVDGPSAMIRRNPKVAEMPSARSMGEFGPEVAAPRILDLLREYRLPASFYVPGWIAERHRALVERIAAEGHEVAHHGYLHEAPATLSLDEEIDVLERGSRILQATTGRPVAGYRSPSWELSPHSVRLLAERGFEYDSSMMGNDVPYFIEAGEKRLVEIPVHWSLDDAPYWAFNPAVDNRNLMASPAFVFDAWRSAFDELYERGRSFVLTCHPWVIGRAGRLAMLEQLIRHILSRPGVVFRRAEDLARELREAS
jgi:peptidoglycan/xylan/chitin deacetylase (PgdA/CDA1 family)